ncbi:hypothetical protein FOZ63_032455 [Perkinsus olseni]|uniref:Uncharacterized protein n=1 Tax=Perkinsus olseni TaxID=32597 RepID=A0A7J6NYZ3_PEROL|nr:hypothetical protein FOZ63_032455 [Perkinsus olseni]KAF4751709.1 hypothetical protein FOZ62_022733 [Perkinsus olseni]
MPSESQRAYQREGFMNYADMLEWQIDRCTAEKERLEERYSRELKRYKKRYHKNIGEVLQLLQQDLRWNAELERCCEGLGQKIEELKVATLLARADTREDVPSGSQDQMKRSKTAELEKLVEAEENLGWREDKRRRDQRHRKDDDGLEADIFIEVVQKYCLADAEKLRARTEELERWKQFARDEYEERETSPGRDCCGGGMGQAVSEAIDSHSLDPHLVEALIYHALEISRARGSPYSSSTVAPPSTSSGEVPSIG